MIHSRPSRGLPLKILVALALGSFVVKQPTQKIEKELDWNYGYGCWTLPYFSRHLLERRWRMLALERIHRENLFSMIGFHLLHRTALAIPS